MALKVWLPLVGELINQGSSKITITNNNTTLDNTGKLGKCYSFDGSTSYLICSPAPLTNDSQEWSFTCWFKPNTSHQGCLFSNRTSVNSSGITIFYYTSQFYIDDGTRWQITPSVAVTVGAWNHLAVIRKAGAYKKLYLNGVLINETTTTGTPTTATTSTFSIGASQTSPTAASGNQFNGYLNDVRIYDHALTALEVHEISQALVCHYKLDKFPTVLNKNILTGTNTQTELIAHNVSVNTNAAGKWGWNSGGNGVCSLLDLTNDSPLPGIIKNGFRVENNTSGNRDFQQSLIPYVTGATYTASWWERGNCTVLVRSWDYDTGTQQVGNSHTCNTETWTYKTWTFTATQEMAIHRSSFHIGVTGAAGTGTIEFCGMKLEVGSSATQWCPNPQDADYDRKNIFQSTIGKEGTKVIDSSGYGNDGLIYDSLTISPETSRHSASTFFNGTSACIKVPYNSICPDNIYTFSLWFKKDSLGTKNYETLFGGPSGYEMDTRSGSSQTLSLYMASTRGGAIAGTSGLSFGEWHHVVASRDGTNEKYYVDGVLKGTITAKNMPTGNYYIGAWSSTTAQNYYGYISDFRIYNTVLSDADVLRLYQTSMMVDKLGNTHGYEFNDSGVQNNISSKDSLILNYKLDDASVEGTTNLVTNLTRGGQTQLINNGRAVVTSGQNKDTYFTINLTETITNGTTYTLSCDAQGISPNMYWVFPLGAQTNTTLSFKIHEGHNEYTFVANDIDWGTNRLFMDDVNRPDWEHPATFYNFQLEKKDHATAYIVGTRENATSISDVSGSIANIKGSLIVSRDTPKLSVPYTTKFDGTNTVYISDFTIGNTWSASCWAKVASDATSGWRAMFILNSTGGDSDTQLGMYINVGSTRMQSSANGKYNSNITVSSANYWKDWHHYMETYDGTSLKTYFDGELKNTTSITDSLLSRSNLTIGGRRSGASTFTTYFMGNIYDVRIYERVLTVEEIKNYYNTSAQRVYKTGVITSNELIENNPANFHKDGIIESTEFIEI